MNNLKELRRSSKFSFRDMSNKLGISKTYYWQLENRQRRLYYEMAVKIADIFEKTPDSIFYEEFKDKPDN